MLENDGRRLTDTLAELCVALAADGGAALYLADGEGALLLAGSIGHPVGRPPSLLQRIRGGVDDAPQPPLTLVHNLPDAAGVVVLARRRGNDFSAQDRARVEPFARRLADVARDADNHRRPSWARQMEALLEISHFAGSADDEIDLASLLTARMRQTTEMDAAVVSRWDDGAQLLHVLWRDGLQALETRAGMTESPIRRQVLRTGHAAAIQSDAPTRADGDESADAERLRRMGAQSMIVLPLNASGRTIGLVELFSFTRRRSLEEPEWRAAEALASLGAIGLEKTRLEQQVRETADLDPVAGVYSHRFVQERLHDEASRSARSHKPFGVLMLDLNGFRPLNDRYGHSDGDRVLYNVGATIKARVRTSDVVARLGADTFVVLMPDTPQEHADVVARRIVAGIVERRHEMNDSSEVALTVRAGLAMYPQHGRTSGELLQAADDQITGYQPGVGDAGADDEAGAGQPAVRAHPLDIARAAAGG